MFGGGLVLIVEDNAYIALDLAHAVEEANGCVLGPLGCISDALDLLSSTTVVAAILDAQLFDGEITPVALQLCEQQVPFVIHTGTGLPASLAKVLTDLPVLTKPLHPRIVVGTLLNEMKIARQGSECRSCAVPLIAT